MAMTDQPIAHTADGKPIYDNAATVVCVLLYHPKGLVGIRRAHEPGKGLIGLPAGFHMRGETWQQAGAREVKEETGYVIDPDKLNLVDMETDEYGHNVVISSYSGWFGDENRSENLDGEAEEVLYFRHVNEEDRSLWAFPMHFAAVRRYMTTSKRGF